MNQLKKLNSWLTAYKKANDCDPTIEAVKFKIKELLGAPEAKSKSKQIYFRESKWSHYDTLRKELAGDKKFVKEYAGVDLKAYIEDCLGWSEKGNRSTDLGWMLTLRKWMRTAKGEGKLKMKPTVDKLPKGGHINY